MESVERVARRVGGLWGLGGRVVMVGWRPVGFASGEVMSVSLGVARRSLTVGNLFEFRPSEPAKAFDGRAERVDCSGPLASRVLGCRHHVGIRARISIAKRLWPH